jgi:DNA-binding NarL/FixJ family response regulator
MTVLIVDDHAVVRKGIVSLLREEILGLETAEAADASSAFQAAMDGNFDLVLLDITLPGRSGLDLLRDLRAARPQLPVLVVSAHAERDYAVRAIKLGAAGYLSKQSAPDALITAVNRILSGRRYLSPEVADLLAGAIGSNTGEIAHDALSNRELEVLKLIATGQSLKSISTLLDLSEKTIATYRSRISTKLGISTNVDLTRYAVKHGLID